MPDYLYGCWMTAQVMDSSLAVPLYDARSVLTGWDEAKVRRVERYLRRIATLSKSAGGATLVESRLSKIRFEQFTRAEILAVHILRFVAEDNPDRAKELHAELREFLALNRGEQAAYQRESKRLNKADLFSKGGAGKKGTEYEPTASIRRVCEEIESQDFDKVLDAFRDGDRCADLYESTVAPINISVQNVDDDRKVIEYCRRGEPATKKKKISFKRLRNILAGFK